MLSRRDMVQKLAAGTVVVVAGASAAKAAISSATTETSTAAAANAETAAALPPQNSLSAQHLVDTANVEAPAAPWELIEPLSMDSEVVRGWRVADLTGATNGSCVLTLRNERGRTQRVHICRNEGKPNGIVFTKQFDLLVMNGGEGDLPTEEGLAQAVAEVAHVLAANEGDRRQQGVIGALMAHNERVRLFSGNEDRRLR
ncbi:MAG: hypothetical protein SF182_10465 [Deltaproteobacteria bacterium]|nr:hypothetical protein [Deltaproteobacteria bacterium]